MSVENFLQFQVPTKIPSQQIHFLFRVPMIQRGYKDTRHFSRERARAKTHTRTRGV